MALTPVQLKSLIDNNIKPNNRKAITGAMMNKVLNEIVDGFPAAPAITNIYNANGSLTGARTINQSGYQITFTGGDVRFQGGGIGVNVAPISGYGIFTEGTIAGLYSQSRNGNAGVFNSVNSTALQVESTNSRGIVSFGNDYGVIGVANQFGVYGYTNAAGGWGLFGYQNVGTAGALICAGNVLFEDIQTGSIHSSAVFQINATTKGALLPRMTTSQFNAISSKATGLMYYNTSRSRIESFNGTFSESAVHTISCTASQTSLTASQTIYFGLVTGAPTTTSGTRKIRVTEACTMSGAFLYTRSGVAGSNEAWAVYIRVNDTTDHLVAIVSAATQERIWQNDSLQIDLIPNDYYEWKMVNPSWRTAPQNTTFGGYAKFK